MSGVKFGVAQAFAERLNNSWSAQDLTMKEKIFELIKESILCLNEEWGISELENPTPDFSAIIRQSTAWPWLT